MSQIDDMLSAALGSFETTAGDTFTWSGNSYGCILAQVVHGEDYDLGGQRRMISGNLEATRSQFENGEPKHRDTIIVNGQKLRIKELDTDSTTLKIRFGSYAE